MNFVDFDPSTFDSTNYKRFQEISVTLRPEDELDQKLWGLEIDEKYRIAKIHPDSQMGHHKAKIGWKLKSIDDIPAKRRNKWKIDDLLTDKNESHELLFLVTPGNFF